MQKLEDLWFDCGREEHQIGSTRAELGTDEFFFSHVFKIRELWVVLWSDAIFFKVITHGGLKVLAVTAVY